MFCLCERKEKVRFDATNNEFWTVHRYFTSENNKSINKFLFFVSIFHLKMHFNNSFLQYFGLWKTDKVRIHSYNFLFSFILLLLLINLISVIELNQFFLLYFLILNKWFQWKCDHRLFSSAQFPFFFFLLRYIMYTLTFYMNLVSFQNVLI